MKKTYSILSSLLIKIAIVVILLLVVSFFSLRIDFTKDKAYSLSKVSKTAMQSLEDVMVVKILSSAELPASLNSLERYTRDLLTEYQRASRGRFLFESVKPNSRDELYQLAQNSGLKRIRFNIYENDQMTSKEVIFGLIFEYQGHIASLDLLPEIEPKLEYEITMRIQRLASHGLPRVAVFRDTTYYDFETRIFETALSSNFDVVETDLKKPVTDVDALLFTGTARNIMQTQLYNLDQYLMRGGKIVFLQDKIDTDGRHLYALDTNVIDLLEHYGLVLSDDIVLDLQCDIRQVGLGNMLHYPMYPVLRGSSHPITQNMDNIVLYLASGISFNGKEGVSFEPILLTSQHSGWMKAPEFEISQELFSDPSYEDFPAGPITTGAIASGSFDSYFTDTALAEADADFTAKSPALSLVIFGDKELVIDPDQSQFDEHSNVILNAIDYLIGRESMIHIRSRHLSSSLLSVPRFMQKAGLIWGDTEKTENRIKTIVKVVVIALPPLILVLIGLIMALRRKRAMRQKNEES